MGNRNNKNLNHAAYFGEPDVYDWLDGVVSPLTNTYGNIVEIKFKGSRKEFYLNKSNISVEQGEMVVVAGDRGGYDVGIVSLSGELVQLQLKKRKCSTQDVLKNLYRKASDEDMVRWKMAKGMEGFALNKAKDVSVELGLQMKYCDAEYQGDLSTVTFYYTANSRVDFRELIKVLSKKLQVYVRMRQISLWEESRRMGNIGPCGRSWCCHNWSKYVKNYTFAASLDSHGILSNREKIREGKFECYIEDENWSHPISKSKELLTKVTPPPVNNSSRKKGKSGTSAIFIY